MLGKSLVPLEVVSSNWACGSVFDPVKHLAATLSLLVCLALAAGLSSLLGQSKKEPGTDKKQPGHFKVPIWLRQGDNSFQTDLKAEDFRLFNGKDPLNLASFQPPQSPTFLFVAFDTVGETAYINEVRRALREGLVKLGTQYWVGLISAQEQLTILQDPTPDRNVVLNKIETLAQLGKAGLLDSIVSVADFTTGILLWSNVRVAVIFITDSDIGNYRTDYLNPPVNASDSRDLSRRFAGRALQEKISRMVTTLLKFQAPIFIVHIDPGRDPLNRTYQNGLKQFAEAVGGQLLLSKTVGDIPAVVQEAFKWVESFYLLGLNVPWNKNGFIRIQVSVPQNPSAPPGRLIYPSRLFFP
jgi:hypothetical protein